MTLDQIADLERLSQLESLTLEQGHRLDELCRLSNEEGREHEDTGGTPYPIVANRHISKRNLRP